MTDGSGGPWSPRELLASDILAWVVAQARAEGDRVPAAVYVDRLAERVGIPRPKLGRLLGGEWMPDAGQLVRLCRAIGSPRAVAALAEDAGLQGCLACPSRSAGGEGPAARPQPGGARAQERVA